MSPRLFGFLCAGLLTAACAATTDAETGSDDIVAGSESVSRTSDGALTLRTATPARVADCQGGACADADNDGLVDAWEDLVLERLRPAVTFDEDEPLLKNGKNDVLAMLGRVHPRPDGHVTVNVLILYTRDYGAPNPVCFHASDHPGDVERVALDLEPAPGRGDAVVRSFFTTGHEGTEDDQSHVWKAAELPTLEVIDDAAAKGKRWRVYASQAKHATYATKKQCEDVRLKDRLHRFCINEDCAPDRIDDRDKPAFTRIPKIQNVGEPGAHRVDDLGPLGYAGEAAWSDATFCGGLAVDRAKTECPPSIKSKLLIDPFAP